MAGDFAKQKNNIITTQTTFTTRNRQPIHARENFLVIESICHVAHHLKERDKTRGTLTNWSTRGEKKRDPTYSAKKSKGKPTQ